MSKLRRALGMLLVIAMTFSLAGCSHERKRVGDASINIEPYSKIEFNTERVKQGDLTSELVLELMPDDYNSKNYFITQSDYKVEAVNVKQGDKVKKDDVMVAFEAKEIQKTIDEYTQQKEEDGLLIEHYTKLMAIDPSNDYSGDIQGLREDIALADTYIKEQNEQMKNFQLIAERDGTVTFVLEDLQYGFADANTTLVTLVSGSADYTATTDDAYPFKVGDTYDATLDLATFAMKVKSVEKYKDTATGLDMQKIIFEPTVDMSSISQDSKLRMTIQKPTISNVLYVNKKAVFEGNDDKIYVYKVDENGYRTAVPVVTGETVDGYTVIKEGVEASDQVVIN